MNPEEDWPIINARQDVLKAKKMVEEHPTPFAALDLQHKQHRLATLSQLTVVRNEDDDEERS
jgi:hypothetical protein